MEAGLEPGWWKCSIYSGDNWGTIIRGFGKIASSCAEGEYAGLNQREWQWQNQRSHILWILVKVLLVQMSLGWPT